MTTLYRPVLIESAEQAEALPWGTIAYRRLYDPELADIGHKGDDGWYMRRGYGSAWKDSDMIGDTALVPIEAEEEHRPAHWMDAYYPSAPKRMQTRYVTPWEVA